MPSIIINRAPVLTLWAAVVAERLGHPPDTALTLGRAVAGFAARVKARSLGREERRADQDAETPRPRVAQATQPAFLLGKEIRLLPNDDGELRAAEGDQPSDPAAVLRYLTKAFGDHLADVRSAMEELAGCHEPAELNRVGFRLYETFRPEVPPGNEGWAKKSGPGHRQDSAGRQGLTSGKILIDAGCLTKSGSAREARQSKPGKRAGTTETA